MPQYQGLSGVSWFYEFSPKEDCPTVLFIHGWGMDRRIWRQQTKHFEEEFQIIAIDLPGHGKSTWQPVTLFDMAVDVINLLDSLKIKNLIIVGSSLGGLLGLKIYNLVPRRIERISFVGSMPKFAQSEDYPHGIDIARMRKLYQQLDQAYPSIVDIFFRSLFTKEERETRRFKWLQIFRRNSDDKPVKPALAEYLHVLEREDLRDVLKSADIAMQFITGTGDELCTLEAIEDVKKLAPQAQYDYFEKCGHFPFLSKAYEFNEVLEGFLKKD